MYLAPLPPPFPGFAVIKPQSKATGSRMLAKLHWKEIKNIHALKDSIWTDIADNNRYEKSDLPAATTSVNIKKFEELFCVGPNDSLITPELLYLR